MLELMILRGNAASQAEGNLRANKATMPQRANKLILPLPDIKEGNQHDPHCTHKLNVER